VYLVCKIEARSWVSGGNTDHSDPHDRVNSVTRLKPAFPRGEAGLFSSHPYPIHIEGSAVSFQDLAGGVRRDARLMRSFSYRRILEAKGSLVCPHDPSRSPGVRERFSFRRAGRALATVSVIPLAMRIKLMIGDTRSLRVVCIPIFASSVLLSRILVRETGAARNATPSVISSKPASRNIPVNVLPPLCVIRR